MIIKRFVYYLGALGILSACGSNSEPHSSRHKKAMAAKAGVEAESADAVFKRTIRLTEDIYSEDFGLAANENIDGKNLFEVITSQKAGRDDGQLCSACHNNEEALGGYAVDSDIDEALDELDTDAELSGRTWTEEGGWAMRFVENETKPANVRAVIQAWIDGGFKE